MLVRGRALFGAYAGQFPGNVPASLGMSAARDSDCFQVCLWNCSRRFQFLATVGEFFQKTNVSVLRLQRARFVEVNQMWFRRESDRTLSDVESDAFIFLVVLV